VNDKFTLIAAATGGLMLSVALSGILKGAPVTNLYNSSLSTHQVTNIQMISKKSNYQKYQD
jgi:hypothetical protein